MRVKTKDTFLVIGNILLVNFLELAAVDQGIDETVDPFYMPLVSSDFELDQTYHQ